MPRLRLLLAALLIALAVLAIACGDDDDGSSATPSDGTNVTASPGDGDPTPSGGDDGDETTPPDDKTPIGTSDGNDGGQPTDATSDATPAAGGVPAVQQPNYQDWLAENYPNVSPEEDDCVYNPATVLATCDGTDYAVDPPLGGEDISCFTQNVNNEAVALRCTSQVPLTTIYYVIEG